MRATIILVALALLALLAQLPAVGSQEVEARTLVSIRAANINWPWVNWVIMSNQPKTLMASIGWWISKAGLRFFGNGKISAAVTEIRLLDRQFDSLFLLWLTRA